MREYMRKQAAERRRSLEAAGMIQAFPGTGLSRAERRREERDGRDEVDGREYTVRLPPMNPYWK